MANDKQLSRENAIIVHKLLNTIRDYILYECYESKRICDKKDKTDVVLDIVLQIESVKLILQNVYREL